MGVREVQADIHSFVMDMTILVSSTSISDGVEEVMAFTP